MKANYYSKYGSHEVLEVRDVPTPVPKKNELLIRIYATTVNRTDTAMLEAKLWIMRILNGINKPYNPILGTDFSGVVEAVGTRVKSYKVGDKVFGFDELGLSSQAQYMCVSEHKPISLINKNTSFAEAAALCEGAHYAYHFIDKIEIKPGDKVLVNGGTGAIGSAVIQLLVHYGGIITATCKKQHFNLVKELGAHEVIDYENENFTESTKTYNYIFDTIGSTTFNDCKKILEPDGTYISSNPKTYYKNIFLALFSEYTNGKKIKFPFPNNPHATINLISHLSKQGVFKPLIDKIYPFEDIKDAYQYVLSGEKIGNVIISYTE
nr:NAD(P)-dependent alcohol dehydrogenase [uncultured Carboxylicivirga sp.]